MYRYIFRHNYSNSYRNEIQDGYCSAMGIRPNPMAERGTAKSYGLYLEQTIGLNFDKQMLFV